jgi:hypothetical protein
MKMCMIPRLVYPVCVFLIAAVSSAPAQDPGTLNPTPLPPLANPDSPKTLAKELFARKATSLPGIRAVDRHLQQWLSGWRGRASDHRPRLASHARLAK